MRGRWITALKAATRQATAERSLASAIFPTPHDAAAFGDAAGKTFQSLVRAGNAVVSAQRIPEKVSCRYLALLSPWLMHERAMSM